MLKRDEIIDKDEVLKMAIQANLFKDYGDGQGSWLANDKNLEAFAKLVADVATAKEREACANICEESNDIGSSYGLAQAIRARGEA